MVNVDRLIDYENGDLDVRQTVELFAELVKTEQAWSLQRHWGRFAMDLIKAGIIDRHGAVNDSLLEDLVEANV